MNPDNDGRVRRVIVKPHTRDDKRTTEKERERAIHDLVLIKESFDNVETPEFPNLEQAKPMSTEQVNKIDVCKICVRLLKDGGMAPCHRFHGSHLQDKESRNWNKLISYVQNMKYVNSLRSESFDLSMRVFS